MKENTVRIRESCVSPGMTFVRSEMISVRIEETSVTFGLTSVCSGLTSVRFEETFDRSGMTSDRIWETELPSEPSHLRNQKFITANFETCVGFQLNSVTSEEMFVSPEQKL